MDVLLLPIWSGREGVEKKKKYTKYPSFLLAPLAAVGKRRFGSMILLLLRFFPGKEVSHPPFLPLAEFLRLCRIFVFFFTQVALENVKLYRGKSDKFDNQV